MNKRSLIIFLLSNFFALKNNAMNLNVTTIEDKQQKKLAVLGIVIEVDTINSLNLTPKNTLEDAAIVQSKKQYLLKRIHEKSLSNDTRDNAKKKRLEKRKEKTLSPDTHPRFNNTITQTNSAIVDSNEKPYKCTMCDKRFTTKNNLTVHFRIHTGERPYLCTECNTPFRHINALKTHRKTHINQQ